MRLLVSSLKLLCHSIISYYRVFLYLSWVCSVALGDSGLGEELDAEILGVENPVGFLA